MTTERFLIELRNGISRIGGVSLSVNGKQACPSFEITSLIGDAAFVKGYYCESGDSFIQIASSGREEYTGNERSAQKFLELINQVVEVLSSQGCLEKRWTNSSGEVRRSVIDLSLPETTYRLGKAPHFWQVGLKLSIQRFPPLLAGGAQIGR